MNKLYLKLAWSNLKNSRQFILPYVIAGMLFSHDVLLRCVRSRGSEGRLKECAEGASRSRWFVFFGSDRRRCVCQYLFVLYEQLYYEAQKKELGIYNILGMEKIHIAKIMAWETVFLS